MPAAIDAVLGGWRVSSVVQAQSSAHLTAYYTSHCGSGTNCWGSEKADAVSREDPNSGPQTLAQWFNTAAYSVAAFRDAAVRSIFIGRFATAEKGAITGPGVWNVDFAAMKDVRFGPQVRLTFNVFATNVFNHANWGRPDTNATSANYRMSGTGSGDASTMSPVTSTTPRRSRVSRPSWAKSTASMAPAATICTIWPRRRSSSRAVSSNWALSG